MLPSGYLLLFSLKTTLVDLSSLSPPSLTSSGSFSRLGSDFAFRIFTFLSALKNAAPFFPAVDFLSTFFSTGGGEPSAVSPGLFGRLLLPSRSRRSAGLAIWRTFVVSFPLRNRAVSFSTGFLVSLLRTLA